ncbi:hypothetical protein CFOL_v3_13760 [Cephalotus follicularis]|uniref:Uncharacterized protein n=1 Tax=Cephalotus follicularis TaxID=3775 RepID=A0A1Q3BQY0_CEPFO|nr:hypothetical protein CFOL_v3_13760 [Cephalotus follicularis]
MASSSSSSYPMNQSVPRELFNMFHFIDRMIFTRLVVSLKRDPAQSMQVMALFMWLEQAGEVTDLVDRMVKWPDLLIDALADEIVLCLQCIESEYFPFPLPLDNNNIDVPFLQDLTKSGVSLRFFHDNRLSIIGGVTKNLNDVCTRAFDDILQQVMESKAAQEENAMMQQFTSYGGVDVGARPQSMGPRNHSGGGDSVLLHDQDSIDLAVQRQLLNNEMGDALSRLQISSVDEEKEVPPDDRSIFMTFSKGYPISEGELKDYITTKFGDCIDTIHMQEIPAEEQPLYARLVLNSPSAIRVLLEGKNKVKFSINGKHAWALSK